MIGKNKGKDIKRQFGIEDNKVILRVEVGFSAVSVHPDNHFRLNKQFLYK